MASRWIKQLIKPAYHFLAVALLTAVFVYFNRTGVISETTLVPDSIEKAISFVLSVRALYVLPAIAFLIIVVGYDFRKYKVARRPLRYALFIVLALLTGKLYTLGALYLSFGIAARHVAYLQRLEHPALYGLLAVLLGWIIWLGSRRIAHWAWRQA